MYIRKTCKDNTFKKTIFMEKKIFSPIETGGIPKNTAYKQQDSPIRFFPFIQFLPAK